MSNTTSILNGLIEMLKDGQQGFTEAAQDVEGQDLKDSLRTFATQREQFATQLQVLARDFGDKNPETSGSVAGAIHRGWIHLKAAIASRDTHAILAECERGEDAVIAAYRHAAESGDLPAQVIDVLQQQFTHLKAAHDRVKSLRDSLAPAAAQ